MSGIFEKSLGVGGIEEGIDFAYVSISSCPGGTPL